MCETLQDATSVVDRLSYELAPQIADAVARAAEQTRGELIGEHLTARDTTPAPC